MRTRWPFLLVLSATLGSLACGPAPEPVPPPPPVASAPVIASAPPPPPTASAPVVVAPEVKPPPAEPSDLATEADMNGSTAHLRVPVGSSAIRGKPTALVTLVMFGEFEDPFSNRGLIVLRQLEQKYGDDLRIVWKDHPLASVHPMAIPLLLAAREAREARGDAGFWQAVDILFQEHEKLAKANEAVLKENERRIRANPPLPQKSMQRMGEAQFKDAAKQLKISAAMQKYMLATAGNPPSIADDMALAVDLRVDGTPTFFLNGRRLAGAQPLEVFTKAIDQELALAREVVAGGVDRSKVYETLQARALRPRPREKTSSPSSGAGMGPTTP